MITALLPICIKHNSFWSSTQGLKSIDDFLGICIKIKQITNIIVISQDVAVYDLAKKYNIEINRTFNHDNNNRQYSFEQIRALAINAEKHFHTNMEAVLILDHRNLFLTVDYIIEAISLYKQNSESGVISLSYCWDYPCQYKSFYNFLDCVIFNFDQEFKINKSLKRCLLNLSEDIVSEIDISISNQSKQCEISFHNDKNSHKNYIAKIIPFDIKGPHYKLARECYVSTCEYKTHLESNNKNFTGIIIILTIPSRSGEYDAVEVFTPENAPWELSGAGATVIDIKKNVRMFGRQQFPAMYTFDGSLSILGKKHLDKTEIVNPYPLILKKSCIVTDLVDYLYTTTDM